VGGSAPSDCLSHWPRNLFSRHRSNDHYDHDRENEQSELKGRAKQAAGNLTDDEDLKREGQTERAADKVKDGVDKIKDVLRKDK